MPALAFGIKPIKAQLGSSKPAPKRKAAFGDEDDDDQNEPDAFSNLQKSATTKLSGVKSNFNPNRNALDPPQSRRHKSPKLAQDATDKYNNLSALRSANLQDAAASQIDSSVYDYDGVYDTFSATALKAKAATSNDEPSGPKYMTSLLESAEVRKRDQMRAKEKLLQKERENEGDEFADKEKFVTGAYKKQQEELKLLEEEEKRSEAKEEERRKKGGGMEAFNRRVLEKEEERARVLEEARKRHELEKDQKREDGVEDEAIGEPEEELQSEAKLASELKEQGAKIVMNDEGEVVDKRQLLGAGLNVAPKKKVDSGVQAKKAGDDKNRDWQRSSKAQDARLSQRERQSRMVERQIEEIAEKQRQAEEEERNKIEELNKSKVTEEAKMGAKERYLQRKKEREEEAARKKAGG